jgi:hypothetical protein
VQNFVKRYGPWRSIIDHNAESYELHFKACHNLETNSKAKNIQGMYYPCLKSFLAKTKIDSVLWAVVGSDNGKFVG